MSDKLILTTLAVTLAAVGLLAIVGSSLGTATLLSTAPTHDCADTVAHARRFQAPDTDHALGDLLQACFVAQPSGAHAAVPPDEPAEESCWIGYRYCLRRD